MASPRSKRLWWRLRLKWRSWFKNVGGQVRDAEATKKQPGRATCQIAEKFLPCCGVQRAAELSPEAPEPPIRKSPFIMKTHLHYVAVLQSVLTR